MRCYRLPATVLPLLLITVPVHAAPAFNRIASFAIADNLPAELTTDTETSAEIIAATGDGNRLVYTDSVLGGIGIIDISEPRAPTAGGFIALEGDPTSVVVEQNLAWVAINTSMSYIETSGMLQVINVSSGATLAECDLGGQPDSVAVSSEQGFVAVAIENERDEELNEGELPQMPAGYLALLPVRDGLPDCAGILKVDLTGIATVGGDDPEPEFVDINDAGEVIVSLQENNHLVVVNGRTGEILEHFSAGSLDLAGIDATRDGALIFDQAQASRAREPDAVKWLDDERFVTANEGDYRGGSRGFTVFSRTGDVLYENGREFEYAAISAGHYPDKRSSSKGIEPEGLEIARFGDETYILVLAERASLAGIYRDTGGEPELIQLLPTGLAPEGAVAVPSRNLMAVSSEADLVADGGVRAHVMIYELQDGDARYPMIVSDVSQAGAPIGWGALSGLVADEQNPDRLYAVSDSFYSMQPSIFTIDTAQTPARIVDRQVVTRGAAPAQLLDLEGITTDGEGGFWLASEGNSNVLVPHALYQVDGSGKIKTSVGFPPQLLASEIRFGAEGITRIGSTVWIAMQRAWKDDPADTVKLLAYDTAEKSWSAVRYPLEKVDSGWVGLSEITAHEGYLYIVERDNGIGSSALIKRLYRVALDTLAPAPLGGELPLVEKTMVLDLLPMMLAEGGYALDKVEGFAINGNGTAWMVTDNDGVDDSSGETQFMSVMLP